MKKLNLSMLAMAGLLFASCADKEVVEGGQEELRSDGYMSVNINLPTTPSTRVANDTFDDGETREYEVQDCALLLFQGENEKSATLISAQNIILPTGTGTDSKKENITTTYQTVAEVIGYSGTKVDEKQNNLYALAVLNYTNVMSINSEGVPTIAGTPMEINTTTLQNIRELETSVDLTSNGGTDKDYFFMTNAVLSEKPGGAAATAPTTSDIYQLAKMDPSKIKQSREEAAKPENVAGEIFVERAVAKATLKVASTLKVDIPGEPSSVAIKEAMWAIDNTQPTSYVARNPGDLSYIGYASEGLTPANYRFVGHTTTKLTGHTTIDAFRTYWCIDPLYSQSASAQNPLAAAIAGSDGKTIFSNADGGTPLYCYENTFSVSNQNYKNTTRAIVKITLDESNKMFWTVTGGTGRFFKIDDIKGYVLQDVIGNTEVKEIFEKNLKAEGSSYTITKEDFDITYETNRDANGQRKVKTLVLSDEFKTQRLSLFKDGFEDIFKNTIETKKIVTKLNERVVVLQYEDGVMYYEARFKHFAGDQDLAPWNTWEREAGKTVPQGGSTAAAYPGGNDAAAKNYLGRYGMVRNNWYDVEVEKITNIGYPVDPSGQVNNNKFDDPTTPDDNINEYISVKIHVLSWAKRTQGWSF